MIENYITKLEQACRDKGIEKFEIRYVSESNSDLEVFEQQVNDARDNASQTVHLAVLQNGKKGSFESENFAETQINFIVEEALANATAIDTEETFFLHDGSGEYHEVKPYQPMFEPLNKLDKVQYLKELEKLAYAADKRINKVMRVKYCESRSELIIRNSLGLNLRREHHSAYAYLYLSAQEGAVIKTDSEGVCFNRAEDFNPQSLIDKVVPRVVSRLNATEIKSQKTRVIFDREMAGNILGAFKSIFSSYNMDSGATKLKGKIGQLIASPLVTIVDNPWLDGGLATRSFDGEGVPTQYKELVKNGILQGFVYGMALADKHGTKTTGNGGGGLQPIFFNLYLENGKVSRQKMLQKLNNGIYIDKLNGIRAGMSVVSGDFSFGAEGFLVENGKITKALNQFTISGNIYDFLQDIEAIGDDLDLSRDAVASPSLLVKNLTVANS